MISKTLSKSPTWLFPLALFLGLLILYAATASTRLTWANFGNDGGDFLSAILTVGIPHPTGYPTYMILGQVFRLLPIGDDYFRAVLLSYLPAALAVSLFAAWVASFGPELKIAGLLAGLVWGCSPLLWSQAVIIEVYGLQSLFSVLALWWCTLLLRPGTPSGGVLVGLAFLFGAGLGNHVTLVFFLPVALVGFFVHWKKSGSIRPILFQAGALALGGLVYLYLPIRAAQYPPINWGNPQTLGGFLWEITGKPYQSFLGGVSANTFANRILASAAILRQQVGVIGIALGIIGAFQFHQVDRNVRWVGLWVFFAYLLFSMVYNTADSTAYLIPVIMIFSGWIGFALRAVQNLAWKRIPLLPVVALGVTAALAIGLPATLREIDPRQGIYADDFAKHAIAQFPENAIVLTSMDLDSFPLWAYHFGYGLRNDIAVVVLPLTQFKWYQETLIHTYPAVKFPQPSDQYIYTTTWGDQIGIRNPDRVVCISKVSNTDGIKIFFTCSNGVIIIN